MGLVALRDINPARIKRLMKNADGASAYSCVEQLLTAGLNLDLIVNATPAAVCVLDGNGRDDSLSLFRNTPEPEGTIAVIASAFTLTDTLAAQHFGAARRIGPVQITRGLLHSRHDECLNQEAVRAALRLCGTLALKF